MTWDSRHSTCYLQVLAGHQAWETCAQHLHQKTVRMLSEWVRYSPERQSAGQPALLPESARYLQRGRGVLSAHRPGAEFSLQEIAALLTKLS